MPSTPLTDAQRKDIEERVKGFMAGHQALKAQFQVDLVASPVFLPAGPNVYGVALGMDYVDLKYAAPSPLSGLV